MQGILPMKLDISTKVKTLGEEFRVNQLNDTRELKRVTNDTLVLKETKIVHKKPTRIKVKEKMLTGEHLGKKLHRHGLFSGDTNELQSVKLSTAKEKAKDLQLAGGLDLLSRVPSVIRWAEIFPDPTLFRENSRLDARTAKPPIMCTNLCDLSVGHGNPGTPVQLQ